jgi:hypothetical protein
MPELSSEPAFTTKTAFLLAVMADAFHVAG